MLCDVDRLKAINDTRGHAAGDDALRRVGRALVRSAASYPGSFVGRIGGDEFGVLLEGRPEDAGGGEAPAIIELAAGAPQLLADDDDPLSVSCGVAIAVPETATPSQLLAAADAAQYLAAAASSCDGVAVSGAAIATPQETDSGSSSSASSCWAPAASSMIAGASPPAASSGRLSSRTPNSSPPIRPTNEPG